MKQDSIKSNPIKVAVAGAGRMGQTIANSVDAQTDLVLAGVWSRNANIDDVVSQADVIIDFSLPEGTELVLDAVLRHGVPLVCGVSGLSAEQIEKITVTATKIPLVYDRNMSLGIAVLERSVRDAAMSLGPEFAFASAKHIMFTKKTHPPGRRSSSVMQ